ncbi:DUF5710 domain-containing protein [Burkholderia anthina]|uniref:DUF5710 domain-containing protein n=1 Tax=Burkholderia anthina TaxID=179879 RepID=UPI0037C0CC45
MTMISLNVPYRDKDDAKRLGAQWNGSVWQIKMDTLYDRKIGRCRKAFLPWVGNETHRQVDRVLRLEREKAEALEAERQAKAAKRYAWENDPPREHDPEKLVRLMGFERFKPYARTHGGERFDELYSEWYYDEERQCREFLSGLPFACLAERKIVFEAVESGWKGYPAEPVEPVSAGLGSLVMRSIRWARNVLLESEG